MSCNTLHVWCCCECGAYNDVTKNVAKCRDCDHRRCDIKPVRSQTAINLKGSQDVLTAIENA